MELLLERLVAGLTNGSLYALLALALVVVFRSTGTLNFAQGELALVTTFVSWWLTTLGVPVVLAVVAAMLIGFLAGAVIERALIRPVQKKNELATLIVALGLFSALNASVAIIWGTENKVMPSMVPSGNDDYLEVFGVRLYGDALLAWGALLALVLVLWVLFTKTQIGLHMRAVADTPESATLSGVKTSRILVLGWGMAGAIGALAGVLAAPLAPAQLHVQTMFPLFIAASAAALFGGLDSLAGAVVGGLTIGVVEVLAAGYVPFLGGSMQQTTALAVIVLVLLFRPAGLFGRNEMERV